MEAGCGIFEVVHESLEVITGSMEGTKASMEVIIDCLVYGSV